MTDAPLHVLGVGNAIVDVIAQADDAFLKNQDIAKGAMTLIDEPAAETLYDAMAPGVEISGGSAANTIAGVASFGGQAGYIGRVRDDQLGAVFAHDLKALGVEYQTPLAQDGPATARCLINVTPDAQRSMSTFLGASALLGPGEIDEAQVSRAAITYLEGYLYDRAEAKQAFEIAAQAAHKADRKVALTLSDGFCVDRHRADFLNLIHGHVDILFANENEIMSLFETDSFDRAAAEIRGLCEVSALTRSEKGSVVLPRNEEPTEITVFPPDSVTDTTGAGDQYAAGFLFGYALKLPLATCGGLGSLAAAEVISHYGARPETSLQKRAAENELL